MSRKVRFSQNRSLMEISQDGDLIEITNKPRGGRRSKNNSVLNNTNNTRRGATQDSNIMGSIGEAINLVIKSSSPFNSGSNSGGGRYGGMGKFHFEKD